MKSTDKNRKIFDEMLARYIDGKASKEEIELIISRLETDKQLAETLSVIVDVERSLEQRLVRRRFLPITQLAAANDKNTCSWDCEIYILNKRGVKFDSWTLLQQAKVNNWLRSGGTPLHNVGRVMEAKEINVGRKYDATIGDIRRALAEGDDVIAVVDANVFNADGPEVTASHAVIIVNIDDDTERITFYDPAKDATVEVGFGKFADAWSCSRDYMVTAAIDKVYDPHPIDVSGVELHDDLEDLTEAIAENAHDVWARARLNEGWRYGPERNDREKTHPDLIEYARLSEREKEYDRIMAMNTLRLIKSMGFDIADCRVGRECANCGHFSRADNNFCSCCGKKLP